MKQFVKKVMNKLPIKAVDKDTDSEQDVLNAEKLICKSTTDKTMIEEESHEQVIQPKSIRDLLLECKTQNEILLVIEQTAGYANLSYSHALRAQLEVIKYISTPALIGSMFDLFFYHLIEATKNTIADDQKDYIRKMASLTISNFFFFMQAKLEAKKQKSYDDLAGHLDKTTFDLSKNILNLVSESSGVTFQPSDVTKLSQIITEKKEQNIFKRIWIFTIKDKQNKEKKKELMQALDTLSVKLKDHYDIIGSQPIIGGLFQNNFNDLMESHSNEWKDIEKDARKKSRRAWTRPLQILMVGCALGSVITWLILRYGLPNMGHISNFSDMGGEWLKVLWKWVGICTITLAIFVSICYRIGSIRKRKQIKKVKDKWAKHYNVIITMHGAGEIKYEK